MEKKLLEGFTNKNCKTQMKKSLELKKSSGEKVIDYMLNERIKITLSTIRLIKKT